MPAFVLSTVCMDSLIQNPQHGCEVWKLSFFFFLIWLQPHCCAGFCLVVVHGLLIAVASLVAEHGLQSTSSLVVAHRVSCSTACGIFPDQG